MPLTDAQKAIKAQTKVEKLKLEKDLRNLDEKINELFNDKPIAVTETTSKEELKMLISVIKTGTANNQNITRFLDLAEEFGI